MTRWRATAVLFGGLVLLLLWAVLAVELLLVLPAARETQPAGEAGLQNAIHVSGEGRVSAEPDMAEVTVGVETRSVTAQRAVNQNASDMNLVMEALADLGIAEEDIQTVDFSIRPEVDFRGDRGSRVVGYVVTNSVRVKIRDIEQVGDVLDAVTSAGANQIFGISFTVEDPRSIQDQARRLAVEAGRDKAEALAEAAGVRLGELISLSEIQFGGPVFIERAVPAAEAFGGGIPVQPGQLEITIQVQLSYAIEQ